MLPPSKPVRTVKTDRASPVPTNGLYKPRKRDVEGDVPYEKPPCLPLEGKVLSVSEADEVEKKRRLRTATPHQPPAATASPQGEALTGEHSSPLRMVCANRKNGTSRAPSPTNGAVRTAKTGRRGRRPLQLQQKTLPLQCSGSVFFVFTGRCGRTGWRSAPSPTRCGWGSCQPPP